MPIVASGQISMLADINAELGLAPSAQLSLKSLAARTLANDYDGAISLSQFYDKIAGRFGQNWQSRIYAPNAPGRSSIAFGNEIILQATSRHINYSTNITQDGGFIWESNNTRFDGNPTYECVGFGAGQFFINAFDDTYLTSPDGITWTRRSNAVPNTHNFPIDTGTQFLVACNNGVISRASTPIGPFTQTFTPVTTVLNSLAFNGSNMHVATGASGVILSSPDGITWTQRTSGSTSTLSVAWNGSIFAAAGSDLITSPDGITWTNRGTVFGNTVASIESNGSSFVAQSFVPGMWWTSPDGITWTQRTGGEDVNFTAGTFISKGRTLWINPTDSTAAQRYYFTPAAAGMVRVTDDGLTATVVRLSQTIRDIAVNSLTGDTIVVGDSALIARRILTSRSSAQWQPSFGVYGTGVGLNRVNWLQSQSIWIVGGTAGQIATSIDNGVSWVTRTSGHTNSVQGFASSSTRIVSVSANSAGTNTIITSDDNGNLWTVRSSPVAFNARSVAWNGSIFVAVGTNSGLTEGIILSSTDGITWTQRTSGTVNILTDVIWTGTQFLAITASNGSHVSTDGITWTRLAGSSTTVGSRVKTSGSSFVATTGSGAVGTRRSIDGITWTTVTNNTAFDFPISTGITFNSVAWDGNRYTIVGSDFAIYTSP